MTRCMQLCASPSAVPAHPFPTAVHSCAPSTPLCTAGGSEAHTTFFQRQRGDWEAATQSRDLLTTVRRFYSNAWTDAEKQVCVGGGSTR